MDNKKEITVLGSKIFLFKKDEEDYICLTDMVKNINNGLALIEKWLRNKNTIEFLGEWEKLYNINFNSLEFGGIKNEAGTNRFLLSVKDWIEKTKAVGITAKAGRYGGTYAHIDIALEFASWISPQFKLYLIKEFRRLKEDENFRLNQDFNIKRILTKINYGIMTNSIKENLIPKEISKIDANKIYANEADILNLALFGITAKKWKEENTNLDGNLRDYADIRQLVCLSNLESLNSVLIKESLSQEKRILKLNKVAIEQMSVLVQNSSITSELKTRFLDSF